MSEELERLRAELAIARHNFDVEFGIATQWLCAYNARTDELIKANAERDAARAALRNLQSLLSLPMYRWRDQEDCLTSMIQSPDGEWLLRDDVLDEVNNAIAESVPDTGTASA